MCSTIGRSEIELAPLTLATHVYDPGLEPQCRLLAGATARIRVDYPLQAARGVFEVVHQPISLGLQLITPLVDYLGYLVKAQRTGNNWG